MGLDKSRKPTIAFWNNSAPTGTMTKQYLELSSGLLLYVYDSATEILYLTVRGSSNITLYDMAKLSTGMPKFSPLSSASLEHGAKGFCFMSKRALNTFQSEIARIFVQGPKGVIPHGVKIPRKIVGYAPELYAAAPDAKSALDGASWFSGQNAAPCTVDMATPMVNTPWANSNGVAAASTETKEFCNEPVSRQASGSVSSPLSRTPSGNAPSGKFSGSSKISGSAVRKELDSKLAVSLFKHVTCNEPQEMDRKNYW